MSEQDVRPNPNITETRSLPSSARRSRGGSRVFQTPISTEGMHGKPTPGLRRFGESLGPTTDYIAELEREIFDQRPCRPEDLIKLFRKDFPNDSILRVMTPLYNGIRSTDIDVLIRLNLELPVPIDEIRLLTSDRPTSRTAVRFLAREFTRQWSERAPAKRLDSPPKISTKFWLVPLPFIICYPHIAGISYGHDTGELASMDPDYPYCYFTAEKSECDMVAYFDMWWDQAESS